MPLYRRNYRDLSPEARRQGAKVVRDQIMAALRSPGLDSAQTRLLQQQLQKIDLWESGAEPSVQQAPSNQAELIQSFLSKVQS